MNTVRKILKVFFILLLLTCAIVESFRVGYIFGGQDAACRLILKDQGCKPLLDIKIN